MSDFPPEQITTARLRLRPPVMGDAHPIFEGYATDPEVTRHLTWLPHKDLDETRLFVAHCIHNWRRRAGDRPWVLIRDEDDALLGMFGAEVRGSCVEIGYVLARPYWGQGYASEALRAVTNAALSDPSVWRVQAMVDVDNELSARALAKAGFAHEGTLRRFSVHPAFGHDPRDVHCYARARS